MIYRVTKQFPKEEIFGITNQMRRCAISITSNIAEGFSRQSYRDKVQFYSISLGSLTELESQLMVARDIGYIDEEAFGEMDIQKTIISKLLNGLIKNSKIHYS